MNYDQRLFLKNFIQQPRVIGSIVPSSKYLCNSMLKTIDFSNSNCIVEYGSGTGIFTKEIIRRKKKDTLFLAFEVNHELYRSLKELHSVENNVLIINDSAENISNHLNRYGIQMVDYVVSGLPFTIIPEKISRGIFEKTEAVLKENGEFITFQYSLYSLSTLRNVFHSIKIGYQLLNLPPAFIYHCKKGSLAMLTEKADI